MKFDFDRMDKHANAKVVLCIATEVVYTNREEQTNLYKKVDRTYTATCGWFVHVCVLIGLVVGWL